MYTEPVKNFEIEECHTKYIFMLLTDNLQGLTEVQVVTTRFQHLTWPRLRWLLLGDSLIGVSFSHT